MNDWLSVCHRAPVLPRHVTGTSTSLQSVSSSPSHTDHTDAAVSFTDSSASVSDSTYLSVASVIWSRLSQLISISTLWEKHAHICSSQKFRTRKHTNMWLVLIVNVNNGKKFLRVLIKYLHKKYRHHIRYQLTCGKFCLWFAGDVRRCCGNVLWLIDWLIDWFTYWLIVFRCECESWRRAVWQWRVCCWHDTYSCSGACYSWQWLWLWCLSSAADSQCQLYHCVITWNE